MARISARYASDLVAKYGYRLYSCDYYAQTFGHVPNYVYSKWFAIPVAVPALTYQLHDVKFQSNSLWSIVYNITGIDIRPDSVPSQIPTKDNSAPKEFSEQILHDLVKEVNEGLEQLPSREDIQKLVQDEVAKAKIPQNIIVQIPGATIPCEGEHHQFPNLIREISLNNPVFISGPAGSGKTTGAERAAQKLGLTYFIQPPVEDKFELFGFIDAGGTYHPSPSYRWATTPGSLLILDEIDRSAPRALCALHMMLANGEAVFPTGQLKVPEENRICATANTWGCGPNVEYVGSAKLDGATLNRFTSRVYWDYDENLELSIALAKAGETQEVFDSIDSSFKIRKYLKERGIKIIWSPRDTIALAKRVASGQKLEDAVRFSVLSTLDRSQFDTLFQAIQSPISSINDTFGKFSKMIKGFNEDFKSIPF